MIYVKFNDDNSIPTYDKDLIITTILKLMCQYHVIKISNSYYDITTKQFVNVCNFNTGYCKHLQMDETNSTWIDFRVEQQGKLYSFDISNMNKFTENDLITYLKNYTFVNEVKNCGLEIVNFPKVMSVCFNRNRETRNVYRVLNPLIRTILYPKIEYLMDNYDKLKTLIETSEFYKSLCGNLIDSSKDICVCDLETDFSEIIDTNKGIRFDVINKGHFFKITFTKFIDIDFDKLIEKYSRYGYASINIS